VARHIAQSWIAKRFALSGEQRAHLANLDAMRRLMLEIRRGRAVAPGPLDVERERKIGELRAAGRLNADQELFLRLCGPEEVDRQHALHRFFGARYDGIIVPSLKNLDDEHRIQKHCVRGIVRAHQVAPRHVKPRLVKKPANLRRFVRPTPGRRRRRVTSRPARSTVASASDGSSDPPPHGVDSGAALGCVRALARAAVRAVPFSSSALVALGGPP